MKQTNKLYDPQVDDTTAGLKLAGLICGIGAIIAMIAVGMLEPNAADVRECREATGWTSAQCEYYLNH